MKPELLEYQSRINRVMDYVNQNLAGDLSLETLSKIACFSPYHFHRIFRSATEETLGEYIRRQRLEFAASALTHRKADTLTTLALDVGFGSLAAFTRAFKDHFGLTPSQWRQQPITAYHSYTAARKTPSQIPCIVHKARRIKGPARTVKQTPLNLTTLKETYKGGS
jgi:AraC family transcriptional regulator